MPVVTVMPHPTLCPEGKTIQAEEGRMLAQVLIEAGVAVPHACNFSGACATCHVYVEQGMQSLSPLTEAESDRLDEAWGVNDKSRLSCRVRLGKGDVVVSLPRYSRNML